MGFRSKVKHIVSFLLHGETRPVVAHISYIQADRQLEGKKIIITGGLAMQWLENSRLRVRMY